MRRRPGWLRKALQSGELAAAARGAESLADVARAMGVSLDAFYCAREQLRADGIVITLESLGSQLANSESPSNTPRYANVERPRQKEVDSWCEPTSRDETRRWPSVEAFDREPPPRTVADDLADRRERAEVASLKARLKQALDQLEQCRYELGVAIDAQKSRPDPEPVVARERMGGKREATAVAMASDWHIEETVDADAVNGVNEFNLSIARSRVQHFFDGFCFLSNYHRDHFLIRDAKLWLGGDLITGYLREENLESNELSPVQAIAELDVWITQGIRQYLDEVPVERLDIDCSSGNHGRLTDKIRPSTREANSIEWLLYHMLARQFANEPRVNFTLPRGAHTYAQVYDLIIRWTHGDGTKGGSGVGGIMIPIRKAIAKWQTVRHAHVTGMGHWHQEHFLSDLLINGSLVGYGPYSLSIPAPFEPPRQSFFLVDKRRGVSMPSTIWLDGHEHEMRAA